MELQNIREIWSKVLKVDDVHDDDDFFDLGGNSLLAAKVITGLRRDHGARASLRTLFENPTLAGFAAALSGSDDALLSGGEAEPQPEGERCEAVGSTGRATTSWQQWNRLCRDDDQTATLGARRPHHIIRLYDVDGHVEPDRLRRALVEVARAHSALRSRFVARDQVVVDAEPDVELRHRSASDRNRAIEEVVTGAEELFDLASAPPFRAELVDLDVGGQVVALVIDHLLADGGTVGVLERDLSAAWRGLPIQPTDYYAWAARQRARINAQGAEALEAWKARLRSDDPLPDLHLTSESSASVPGRRARPATAHLDSTKRSELLAHAAELRVTPFVLILAAWADVLARESGSPDVTVICPLSGRDDPETAELVGWVSDRAPLRLKLEGSASFLDTVWAARDALLDADELKWYPYGLLARHLAPTRFTDQRRHPWAFLDLLPESAPVPLSDDIRLRPIPEELTGGSFEGLSAWVMPAHDGGLDLAVRYDAEYLHPDDATRIAGDLVDKLAMIAEPSNPRGAHHVPAH